MNRLETLCKVFNWKGCTIHEATREAEDCLETNLDILGMSDSDFRNIVLELNTLYPSYKTFQYEREE